MGDSLKRQTLSGFFWKFGERISAQLISLVVSVILARMLEPADYGAVAIVMIFITIANVFVTNGFGSALVQKKDADNLDFSSVFWVNLLFSFLIYLLIYASAPYIAAFYNLNVLKWALRILGFRVIIAAVNSLQQAYVSRNMLFKRFFWSTLFGTILSGVVGILIAYKGGGVWALVFQYLTNTTVDTFVLWVTVRWRPEIKCSIIRAKKLISYGWKLLASALLDTVYHQLRNLLIGKIYTTEDLAYYNQGDKYPSLLVTNVNSSLNSVLFPVMSRYQNDSAKLKDLTRKTIQLSAFVMWPLMLGLAAVAEPLVHIVLTDKWLPCVPYLRVFCLSYGLWPIHTSNLQAIAALGRSDLFLKLELVKKGIGLIALVVSISYGPMAMAISLVITGVIGIFINSAPNVKLIEYKISEQLYDLLFSFFTAGIMFIIVWKLASLLDYSLNSLIFEVILGAIIYIGLSVILKTPGLKYIWLTLKGFVNRRKDK